MIVFYSGMQYLCRVYVEEVIEEQVVKGVVNFFGEEYFRVSFYFIVYIWFVISDVIGIVRQVMDYVKDLGVLYV